MPTYHAPLEDMSFLIDELLDSEQSLGSLSAYEEYGVGPELTTALLDEAAKLAGDVLAPLRRVGDLQPAHCSDGRVEISPGYQEALQQMAAGGWLGIAAPVADGGQGLPELYGTAVTEMWNGANMALALKPFLTIGAAMAIAAHGDEAQRSTYVENMYGGQWGGTMNLTEAGAGSDLGAIKTVAVPEGEHFRIRGQKIFISWGDHEACENIVHLVLAKTPDAPEGSRGISLFIVPKFLVNADGSLGERNDVYPVSCEHKMGIHGSPTCVMAFGDNDGAIGYLLGEKNRGLACMFTMMNEARLKVGLQGLGAADGAFQKALAYAKEREQGGRAIIEYPDVKRMLMTMKSLTEAGRAYAYTEAQVMDLVHAGPEGQRSALQARIDLMIPVIKAWLTEVGQEVASIGMQVHGGMGYVEETGAAQYLRDVRVTTIYEGTTGIQAADLVARKLGKDGGSTMEGLLSEVATTARELSSANNQTLKSIGDALALATQQLTQSTARQVKALAEDTPRALGSSCDYLMQTGYLLGGWHLARSAQIANSQIENGSTNPFYERKVSTTAFYCERILPRCAAHAAAITDGSGTLESLESASI